MGYMDFYDCGVRSCVCLVEALCTCVSIVTDGKEGAGAVPAFSNSSTSRELNMPVPAFPLRKYFKESLTPGVYD